MRVAAETAEPVGHLIAMNAVRSLLDCDLRRIEAEYLDVPGLKLTAAQASRFWQFDTQRSEALLDSLVEAGVLYRARDGAYLLLIGRPRPWAWADRILRRHRA